MIEEKNLVLSFIISATLLLGSTSLFAQSEAQKIMDDKESAEESKDDHTYKFRVEPNNKDGLNSPNNRDVNTDGPAGNPAEANLKNPTGMHPNSSPITNP